MSTKNFAAKPVSFGSKIGAMIMYTYDLKVEASSQNVPVGFELSLWIEIATP